MPESPTGDSGGRGNTRSPGTVAEGFVVITIDRDVMTMVTAQTTVTDRVIEVSADMNSWTYNCASGRGITLPGHWRNGEPISVDAVTWSMTPVNYRREMDVTTFGDEPRVTYGGGATGVTFGGRAITADFRAGGGGGGYAAGGAVGGAGGGDVYVNFAGVAGGGRYVCECRMCRQERAIWTVMGATDRTETPEQANARQLATRRRRDQAERYQVELLRKAAEADARAEETLRMVLKPDELAKYERTGRIVVTGSDGKRYWIREGIVNNVWLLRNDGNEENPLAHLCCHPSIYADGNPAGMPYKDAHIAQILYLRHDIDKFYDTANINWRDIGARDSYLVQRRLAAPAPPLTGTAVRMQVAAEEGATVVTRMRDSIQRVMRLRDLPS